MEKKNKRQLQSEHTKEVLVETLASMIQDKYLNQITIRDICNKANVSTGTFYLYFSSKEEALLYIYHSLDKSFTSLTLGEDPIDNLRLILSTYYHLLRTDQLDRDRELYKSHLTFYDNYFFSEDRSIYQYIYRELKSYTKLKDPKDLTWSLLEFMRGRMYIQMIKFASPLPSWYEEQVNLTISYLKFLINEKDYSL